MSLSSGLIAVVALAYMAIMFAIAFYGDRRSTPLPPRLRAWVYSLSLAVYCTSWTFFGAVGQAAEQLWAFLPIYLGPVLLLIFAPWVLQKMVLISKQQNITSIADFIAARYGKSQTLAVVVALICLVGVLPYIALQLKGIVLGVNLLIGANADATGTRVQDTALVVSLVLALFAIVFGTRSLDVTEHHRGMVLAIAFESMIKLLAFLAVGAFVVFNLYDGVDDLFSQARQSMHLERYWQETINWPSMVVQTAVAMMAIICLPRQFHVTVVENIEPQDMRLARWVFPLYLVLAALFVVPIALAGQMLLPGTVMSDSFVSRPIPAWRCWRSSAAPRPPPAWSSSRPWRCRPWSPTTCCCPGCCAATTPSGRSRRSATGCSRYAGSPSWSSCCWRMSATDCWVPPQAWRPSARSPSPPLPN